VSKIAFHRALAGFVVDSAVRLSRWGGADQGRQDKSAGGGPAHVVVRATVFARLPSPLCWRFKAIPEQIQLSKRRRRSNCAKQ
jgi:hypothetical protein